MPSAGITTPITDEERRWVVIGVCLTKVLTPALRNVLATEMPKWYNVLCQPPTDIDKQVYGGHQEELHPSTLHLNYKSINNNDVYKKPRVFDYTVKDPLSLAKLFVLPFMCKFTGFDQTMDTSAVLSVICEAAPFAGAAAHAKEVRSDIRNEWGHCNFANWTEAKFEASFLSMETLLKNLNLSAEDEKKLCDDLYSWKDKGFQLCFGQPVDMEVFTLLRSEVGELCELLRTLILEKEQVAMLSNRLKNNGERLCRLIIDQGTETMRKYFDSIHPPDKLTATLNARRRTLQTLRRRGVINFAQMNLLFPPAGTPTTTSKDYDITLLFILLRNICDLTAPASTGSWYLNPPSADPSPEADLLRIKYYRNKVYAHKKCTEVSDDDFNTYWSEISDALVRLSLGLGVDLRVYIAYLKTSPLHEDRYIGLLNKWYENDEKDEVLILAETEKVGKIVEENRMYLRCIVAALIIFAISVFYKEYGYTFEKHTPDPQNVSNPGFVGREWVFRKLENIINSSDAVRGVLLVTGPGWGKSAIMRQLINSSSSSAVIHENIIGYHFCKYNDKSTRDGEQFLKNFVHLIDDEIKNISGSPEIDIKNDNCKNKPIKCFQKAIVEPLKKLTGTGRNRSFILIDALDECLEKEESRNSIILKILYRSVPDLPNWVKLIVTSRNQAQGTGKISKINGFSTLKINVEDQRNEHDLRTYANQTLQNFSSESETSSTEEKLRLEHLIDLALESSKGNFLFLETIIKYWQKYPHKMNAQSIPESLGDIYTTSFAERFKEDDLDHFEPLLEVLLAANAPPTLPELEKICDIYDKNYNARKIVIKLSEYFKSDFDQGPLEFHHQFFAEWLTNQTNGIDGIVIQKAKGHQRIVVYLFHFYNVNERQTNLTLKELSELCIHILHAGEKEIDVNRRRLSSLNVSEVRDSSERCILHDLAPIRDATKIIAALIKQFNSVDILDDKDWTPAMYAVRAGSYENVKLFIDNGANVNYTIKRDCSWSDFIFPNYLYSSDKSINYIAVYNGNTKIAELLITSGAEIEKADECGWKPLYLGVVMGHFEIVQLYINKGAQADTISLHHAAARNHTEIVRFLLNTGVRDTCLPCKPGNLSWCSVNLFRFHHCFCETALHAAVFRNNLEIAKLILDYGNASVNCKHGSGRTPLMEAILRKNTPIVKLLLRAGANIDTDCESSTSCLFYECSLMAYEENVLLYSRRPSVSELYSQHCNQPLCYNGNRDFSIAHGLYLPKGKLNASLSDFYVRWSVATVASINDEVDFIHVTYGNRINSIPNIETTLRYVAICHSVKILKHLLNIGDLSKFTSVYEDGKTLLHFATLGSSKRETEDYVTKSCASSACVCPNKTGADIVDQKRLETVKLLTKELISEINKQDKYGRTALHYAAVHALPKIVKFLVNVGADWSIEDQRSDTALEYALRERTLRVEPYLPCQRTSDEIFEVCQITIYDEMASYLVQKTTIEKCDKRVKKLLDGLLYHKVPAPLILYELFKSGLDVNCAREHFKRYLNESVLTHWRKRYDEILEVFKIFQINVEVICDVPFSQSELHLIAYLRTPSDQVGNLFQPSVNGSSFPLQRFITSHPKGVDILNECYDKEGYLAIHRAVQGTNFDAVSWFIEMGVDLSKKTKSGLTALALATYNYLGLRCQWWSQYKTRRRIFETLLEKTKEKSHTSFHCNTELIDLSPLHIAGSQGMEFLEIIHRKMPELPLHCTNNDGIQPIYLAYLYHAVFGKSSDDEQAFQNLGLSPDTAPLEYPEREAEYHLIYNQLFLRTPKVDLRNVLNHEGLFECPGINELLPHKTVIKEYIKQRACATRCWLFAFEASRAFSSNFRYLDIQNKRQSNTLEKKLWRKVTKAHSCAHNCFCFEVMLLLQEKLTIQRIEDDEEFDEERYRIRGFVAERMGWTDTSREGDVLYRWPFNFLLKKALRTDKAYKYLEILSPHYIDL